MTKDEALRLALEALENSWTEPNNEQYEIEKNAITAIKEALETKDEPVAWGMEKDGVILDVISPDEHDREEGSYTVPLYTTPQRTWVGLTELDCVGWFGYDTGLRLWFEADKNDDGAIPLYKNALETKDATVQVSPLEFVEMVMEKEHLIGQPIFWAQWPNEEKK